VYGLSPRKLATLLHLAAAITTLSGAVSPGAEPASADELVALPLPVDTAAPLELHSATLAEPQQLPASTAVMRLMGVIGPLAVAASFLADSGATALFMDTALAKRCGLVLQPSGRQIKLADGTLRAAAGTVTASCALLSSAGAAGAESDRLVFEAEFCVTELLGHEAILGMPWLQHFNPSVDWRTGRFTIERPAHRAGPIVLTRKEPRSEESRESEAREPRALSAAEAVAMCRPASRAQWDKMMRKGQLDLSSMEVARLRLDVEDREPRARPTEGAKAGRAARRERLAAAEERPQHAGLTRLLAEFADVAPEKLGPLDPSAPSPGGIAHRIDLTPDAKAHAAPLRRYSPLEDAEIRRVVEEQVALGRMRESTSPWGAMVLLAKKKDGTLRFCVDYRVLNNSTVKNRYALPLADDCFDRARGARFFSKLDLHSGFWQIRLDELSAPLTAFRTRFGHYEYTVLPMGLCNAPGTFMHVMNSVFRAQLDRFMLVFLDDIFIYSATEAEHLLHLREVLTVLRAQRLYLKPSKCEWMLPEVEFLGHRIGRDGLSVDPHKVDAVRQWPAPRNVSELRSFLGLAGYYRRFLEGYSQVALPLTELTKDEVEWRWGEAESGAFERLKLMLSCAPVLQLADPTLPYVIHCDASGFAVGACLMQDHGSGLQPVSFISAKMKPAETRYAPHEQELLSLVYACRAWRHYLHNGHPFTVLSDHQSLRFFTTQPILSARQARWKDLLAEFDFTIRYIEGPKNVVADALSRRADHAPNAADAIEQRLRDARAVSKDEFLASIVIDEKRDDVPLAAVPCAGRALPHALAAAQLRGRRVPTARAARPAQDPEAVAAERQRNRDAAEKLLPPASDRPAPNKHGAIVMPSQRCTAATKTGGHCGARTKRGQFCYTHRKQLYGIRIAPATERSHGMGIRATRLIPPNTDVSDGYKGELVVPLRRDDGGPYYLGLRIKGGAAIDAARTNTADGRWLNDPRGVKTADGRRVKPNCQFVCPVRGDRTNVTIRTTRAVQSGEELYIAYGQEYWNALRRAAAQAARARAQAASARLAAVAELNTVTVAFGDFSLVADARDAAQRDEPYAAQLASPPVGWTVRDGLLWWGARLVVPNDAVLRTRLLAEMHDTPTGGHFGRDKTLSAVRARFHWAGIGAAVEEYVRGCDTCQRVKHSQQRTPGLLMPLPVPEDIDSHWTMDFVTGLPRTAHGHDAIQGHFSRGGSLKRLAATDTTADAARAADTFVSSVVRHHGVPASIVSDRGPQFVARFWNALWARLGTKLERSTAYHAQTDGLSEREQKTMGTWLRAFCAEFPDEWDTLLPLAELALNCMPQASSGVAPYELLYGRNPALSVDRALAPDMPADGGDARADAVQQQLAAVPAAQARWARMAAAWTKVRGKLLDAQQRMARNADRHRREAAYSVGDMVLLSTAHLRINDPQFNAKLAHLYCGPFPVLRVVNANAYELELPAHMHIHAVVNISHLRPYVDGRVAFPDRPAAPGLSRPPPDAEDANGEAQWLIERVLAQKGRGASVQFLVLWKGYSYTEASWEPAASLAGAQDALAEFRAINRRQGGAAAARGGARRATGRRGPQR